MYEIYTVDSQDTISSIAEQFGTTEDVIYQINGLSKGYVLTPGSQIIVPKDMNQPYSYYTVKKGDTISQIAKDYKIDYQLLLQLNGLEAADYIYPNQTLILPKSGYQIYLTKNDDTIRSVLKKIGISLEQLMKDNDKIYLRPEQIIVFRKK